MRLLPESKNIHQTLAQDGKYEQKELANIPNVTLYCGNRYDETDLQNAYKGVQQAFANINGFVAGEKAEIYWGIHMYELAVRNGLEHFVWAGVDYGSKLGRFAPKYRCGHLDGKSKYLKSQPTSPVMLSENWRPQKDDSGTCIFAVPLGNGASPMIHLEGPGLYARWIFNNPIESKGINLEVATTHIGLNNLIQTFRKVTGKPARAIHLTPEKYFADGYEPLDIDKKLIYGTDGDYVLLDKILPTIVKILEE
ncbi:hypothetical protein B0J13DRAFT_590359 [Dactylonectria estremocensis]|uniref:NmrA-like domain-containing protein n=1 Tax=Dactylonectria estremocensis TaxID=1079267 RepID=A0A9P9ICI5_9HYPO|nr:hypothetical protein B0J13DRAFT_590359 [Dactylonectria estremocensis]